MRFSCVIPAKDPGDPQIQDLVKSIRSQDFQQDQVEILVISEGDSEQAKAIGIRRSKGDICLMLCADNILVDKDTLGLADVIFKVFSHKLTGIYSKHYAYVNENSLGRYFSLIGANDLVPFYLGKADRRPWYEFDRNEIQTLLSFKNSVPSLGCNGFFFNREHLLKADLDHYYPMDVAEDLRRKGYNTYMRVGVPYVHHKTTDGNLLTFLWKRYKYARDLYCNRRDRRWRMVGNALDKWRLFLFVLASITIVQPCYTSVRAFTRVKDWAWFWHPIVCLGFTITYGILCVHQLLSHRLDVGRLFKSASRA